MLKDLINIALIPFYCFLLSLIYKKKQIIEGINLRASDTTISAAPII
ncbi:hypothetical protein CLJ_0284 (plasmid) [Clostridium botulinum Ba4 str. 657]|uniref:Uncharacterized protein n=1 Tax=Clostridium botulinum (strain 657 / Type Ba4) TaxID=515621 RepID=A0A3F2ZR08_CLOB6|nr:hypothetical protein CLJ_0284 [Clostridium botulinum Ba4 str. 657]